MEHRRRRGGWTAVELCAVVSVIGVLLAVFVPTFLREVRVSKTSEAPQLLAELHRRSAAYFARVHSVEVEPVEASGAEGAAAGGEGAVPLPPPRRAATRCLPDPAGPTPRRPRQDLEEVEFRGEESRGRATWAALGFQPDHPTRFAYTFDPTSSGCDLRSPPGTYLVTLRAEGDLDGDGERSVFERRATATEDGDLVPFGIIYVRDRAE